MELDQGVLQRSLFRGRQSTAPRHLYVTALDGVLEVSREELRLMPRSHASLETYFGRFPAAYYQRWTDVTQVDAQTSVSGRATISLHGSDRHGEARIITKHLVHGSGAQAVTLGARLDRFLDGGFLWLEVESYDTEVLVAPVSWSTLHVGAARPVALVICTYNRTAACVDTLSSLSADEATSLVDHIYVVDQGSDLVADRAGFRESVEAFGGRLHYIRQPNLGGAGGFARGIVETLDNAEEASTDVILMDDDVAVEPETLRRLIAFSRHVRQPVLVGGQMLYALHPSVLHPGPEEADLATFYRGPVPGVPGPMDLRHNLPHARLDAGYNGWWCCLIPAETLQVCGLPMPFFVQWDDTEYGIRAAGRGMPTVTLPGAAVWHADFAWRGEDWSAYFGVRNGLIASAVHGALNVRAAVTTLGRMLAVALVGMEYGLVATMLAGIEAFLVGPAILSDGGTDELRRIQDLRSTYPDTRRHSVTEATSLLGTTSVRSRAWSDPGPRYPLLALVRQLTGQLHNASGGAAMFSAEEATWWRVARHERVIVTDPGQEAVRFRSYDRATALALGRLAAGVLARLFKEAAVQQPKWQESQADLCSLQTWRQLFEGKSATLREPASTP